MNSVEEETITKVVSELEKTLPGMIHTRDEEVREVVQLFRKVSNFPQDKVTFVSGRQFVKLPTKEYPLRPFKILAEMLRKFWINHQPIDITVASLLAYKHKYEAYIN
jgi:hypothetical protein